LRDLELRVRELAKRYVRQADESGGECDFVPDIAMHYPLYVILSLLRPAESDFAQDTQTHAGDVRGQDTELQRGQTPEEQLQAALDMLA